MIRTSNTPSLRLMKNRMRMREKKTLTNDFGLQVSDEDLVVLRREVEAGTTDIEGGAAGHRRPLFAKRLNWVVADSHDDHFFA